MSTPQPASAERRATLLHAAARVAKNIASILDPDQLLQRTVDSICEAFGFYYAGVFLLDETGEWAVLRAGHGAPGAAMVAQGHKLAVGGDSMIGTATGQRQARIALDVGEEAVHFKNPFLPDTRSEMALPLVVGPEVIGALTVQSTQEAAFTQEDIETLQTMADQLAIAIKNAHLHRVNQALLRQAERQAHLLQAATQVGRETTAILDLDALLPTAVDIICDAYGFYYAGIFMLDERGEWAVLRAGHGQAGAAMLQAGHKLQVGSNSMIGACIANRQARIALDVGAEAVFFKNPYLPKTRSEMALPLISHGQVLGAMTVQSTQEAAFDDQDIASLQAMADQLAVAIHNARLLRDLERTHAELLRTRTYEALATATTQAIHWIGNKALPITTTVARMQQELAGDTFDVASLREDLEMVAESARLIVAVKENLLGPAREHMPRPVMLIDVAQAAAHHVGLPADMLVFDVAPDAPLALGDSTQLVRALGNLLRNAHEAHAGRITVSVAPADDGYVSLTIADDGDGIPADVMDKIWAAFFTTKGPQHSGLGLPACLHILSQMDGRIAVESQPGAGATFMITLPAGAAVHADLSAAPPHVLLVDDADPWAEFVLQALTAAGKHVAHLTAVSQHTADQAELILVDETLTATPVGQVLEALQEVGAAAKTVVITAAPQVERTTAYLQHGVKDVALKPYTLQELATLLR